MIFEQLLLVLVLVLQSILNILCRELVEVDIYKMTCKTDEEIVPAKVVILFSRGFSL